MLFGDDHIKQLLAACIGQPIQLKWHCSGKRQAFGVDTCHIISLELLHLIKTEKRTRQRDIVLVGNYCRRLCLVFYTAQFCLVLALALFCAGFSIHKRSRHHEESQFHLDKYVRAPARVSADAAASMALSKEEENQIRLLGRPIGSYSPCSDSCSSTAPDHVSSRRSTCGRWGLRSAVWQKQCPCR